MATKTITLSHEAGQTCWLAIFNQAGQVWDFTAGIFRSLASAANFSLALTPDATETSYYQATVDLATLNATAAPINYVLQAFEQPGGSPDLADLKLISTGFTVQLSAEVAKTPTVEPVLDVTIDGTDIELTAWLETDGQLVDLDTFDSAATCDVQLREHSAGAVVFQVDDADNVAFALSANVANHFEMTAATVITSALDDSSGYLRVTIVENGNTWVRDYPCAIFGGS
uniref:Uncharacterized protein n=1 Tax=uncultured marine virus TaxID=186617 RepID=A0A0F7LAR1_9VIRU|nr:hypothetical protein [uncultured marine virus]